MSAQNDINTNNIVPDTTMSFKQVEAGDPTSKTYLRKDKRMMRAPGPGEVLVQNFAASLNQIDGRICLGQCSSIALPPLVPGSDFAGMILFVFKIGSF